MFCTAKLTSCKWVDGSGDHRGYQLANSVAERLGADGSGHAADARYDYFSCPQAAHMSTDGLQKAIDSIPAYVSRCRFDEQTG